MTDNTQNNGLMELSVIVRTYNYDKSIYENKNRTMYVRTLSDVVSCFADSEQIRGFELSVLEPGSGRFDAEVATVRQCLEDYQALGFPCSVPVADAWKTRELRRFERGTYKPFPATVTNYLYDCGVQLDRFHYVHIPIDSTDLATIAYTESPEKGQKDKQTVVKFGRYLKRYFPELSEPRIQEAVSQYRTAQTPHSYTLHFTTDRAKISDIFETMMCAEGSSGESCMYGKFTHLGNERPYHVYGDSPDVAVAYLVDETTDNKIVARTVVSTKYKRYVRFYGIRPDSTTQEAAITTLSNLIKEAGYAYGDLDGCRLSKVKDDRLPYLDGDAQWVTDTGKYWEVTGDEDSATYAAHNTDGAGTALNRYSCSECDNSYSDEDELTYIECADRSFCSTCVDNLFVQAVVNRRSNSYNGRTQSDYEYCRIDETVNACDGETYAEGYADTALLTDDNGEYHIADCSCRAMERETCTDCDDSFHPDNMTGDKCDSCHQEATKNQTAIEFEEVINVE